MAILGWILAVISLVCFLFLFFAREDKETPLRKWAPAALGLLVVGVIFTTIATIPRGHVGVAIQFRGVTGDYKEQGLQFKSPVVKLKQINIQTQKYELATSAASKDLQDVTTTIVLNYHLSGSAAPAMYETLGEDYIEKLADPAIHETVKQVTARYLAEELILKRPAVKQDITTALSERLAERGIVTEAVSMTNFAFSPVFAAAIEAKVAALQAVAEAQNKLERVKVEAMQAEEAAVGRANAVIAEAEGQAQAIRIVTAAQVRANEDITASLNAEILRYIMLDRFGENIQIWVVPEGQEMVLPAPTVPPVVEESEPETVPEATVVPEEAELLPPETLVE